MSTQRERERNAKGRIEQWRASKATKLSDVYGRYSKAKENAFEYCKHICYEHYDGRNLKIIGHNSNIFTAGFEFIDPDTGVVRFMYITPSYNTVVDM